GLVAAAYLLKAGLDVCVIESYDKCGGGAITEELTLPGFKHDSHSFYHSLLQVNPLISQDELGLKSKYGLKYINYDPGEAFIFPDDRALIQYQDIDKTCESIAQFSERDAEAYRRFIKAAGEMRRILVEFMFSPPPTFGNMISFLEASEVGREYLRIIMGSPLDLAEDWFESDEIRAACIRSAAETITLPQQQGTGQKAFVFSSGAFEIAIPEGGSGALSEALIACIRDNGGVIKISSPVKAIKIEAGEAKGVVLDTGEEIMATKAVVSSINVKQLFLEMLKPDELPAGFQEKVKRIKQKAYIVMPIDFALNEAPRYKAGGDVNKTAFVRICPLVEGLLRMYEDISRGIPQTGDVGVGTPTLVDPTRAPEGKHILFFWLHEPADLKEGGLSRWNEIKEQIADGALETLRKHTTNLGPENILGRSIRSPLDLERQNPAWPGGHAGHIGDNLSQLFANRPLIGWGHYRTPVKKLYMCGASTHPSSGINGGSRAAMPIIMEDLGIDFKKVIAK
ncbi:MAG: phytoene desaturase family protein, partial [Dehalococcoidia bacterium]